jgi:hypothetical protein
MLNAIKIAATGAAVALAIVASGGLVILAALAWQAYANSPTR